MKPRPVVGRKHLRLCRVGLQQHPALCVAHDIGEKFVVIKDDGQPLRGVIFLTPEDVQNREWQQVLRGFLQR